MLPRLRVPHKLALMVGLMLAAHLAASVLALQALQLARAPGAGLEIALALLLAGAGVAGTWLALSIRRATTVPIQAAAAALRRVADGDMTVRVDAVGHGAIADLQRSLSDMAQQLRALVGDVAAAARGVAASSAQIAQGNLDLSQRTEEQAGTLEQASKSLEELTSTVARNAESARQAVHLAIGASEVARRGGLAVDDVVGTMSGIASASRRITDIIGVIDGIAFQTNILALNAAVEAARAGEQGRGFAVVAAEVRSLAQRSALASREIKTLIADSTAKVDAGTTQVDAAGRTMQEIVDAVEKVTDLIGEIAAASQAQSSGLRQVDAAVTQMGSVVRENASVVEEAAAATGSMKEQAGALLRTVARFKVDAGAAGGPQAEGGQQWNKEWQPAVSGRAMPATWQKSRPANS